MPNQILRRPIAPLTFIAGEGIDGPDKMLRLLGHNMPSVGE